MKLMFDVFIGVLTLEFYFETFFNQIRIAIFEQVTELPKTLYTFELRESKCQIFDRKEKICTLISYNFPTNMKIMKK